MATVKQGTLFPAELATEMFSKVKGHSSVAKMAASEPIPFAGKDVFTFNFESDISIVGESAAKPEGGAKVEPIQIRPIKVIYQSRVSDEFVRASEEKKLQYLKEFANGWTKRLGAGLDLMSIHGINPATGEHSAIIGDNYFDNKVENIVIYNDRDAADALIDDALALLDEDQANGIIISPSMRGEIAKLSVEGARKYPEFAWGATPNTLGSMTLDTNKTLNPDKALMGNWNAFKWGFSAQIPLEVIEYGDPDGQGRDLKQFNEVLLRSEAYIGWGILDASDFAMVKDGKVPPTPSSDKEITTFSINGTSGNIDNKNHTVEVTLAAGTDVKKLEPSITVSRNATVSPASGVAQDFTNPVTYTVTAEDGSTQDYTVTVVLN